MQENQQPEPLPTATSAAGDISDTTTNSAVPPAPTLGANSGDAPAPASAGDTLPSLEERLKAAELKAAEHQDAWLRAKAEGENIRRRAQDDIAKAGKFAIERFAGELLAVKDSLEAALANENQSADALKSGVELTLRQLVAAFETSQLAEISPAGQKFDPHKHQAISQIEAPDPAIEANTVVTVLQKGYQLNERVIRPALVIVAKARSTTA